MKGSKGSMYPRHKVITVREAGDKGWCKMCKNPCFDPEDFAKFAGKNGADVTITKTKGGTSVKIGPMKVRQLQNLLKNYVLALKF